MKILNFLLIVFIFLIGLKAIGQKNVNLTASTSVNMMMEKFVTQGKSNETIKAWRIQIITTDDRREMEKAKSMFSSLYPNINVDWKHVAPYYQVRVGYYETVLYRVGSTRKIILTGWFTFEQNDFLNRFQDKLGYLKKFGSTISNFRRVDLPNNHSPSFREATFKTSIFSV